MPSLLAPETLFAAIAALPRGGGAALMVLALSMMVYGMHYARLYVALTLAMLAVAMGVWLAGLMHVQPWFVAAPAALIGSGLGLWGGLVLTPVLIAILGGWSIGIFSYYGMELRPYWPGFAAGAVIGLVLGVITPKYVAALASSAMGALLLLTSLGSVLRAPTGPFSAGGFANYPFGFVSVGLALCIGSMILQVALEPPPDFSQEL